MKIDDATFFNLIEVARKDDWVTSTEAKTLGLNGTSLRNEIPNHCTFSHFERRLALDGMREIFEILVMQVRSELDRRGMTLGANVAIDSTPITGKPNDPDAKRPPVFPRCRAR